MYTFVRVLSYARSLWPYYVGITIFAILMALTALASPFIVKAATDLVVNMLQTGDQHVDTALWLALLLFAVDVSNTLFSNWGGYLGDMMSVKLKKQLSERYYSHLLKLPQSYYDIELTGTIINRLDRTIFAVTQFINVFVNNFFQMILTTVFGLLVVFWYSWELGVLLAVIYPLFFWFTAKASRRWQRYQVRKNAELDKASGRFAEVISQIRVVKSFIQENTEYRHFERRLHKTVNVTHLQSAYWHDMDMARRLALNAVFFIIFAYIFTQTASGRFTIGEMVLLVQIVVMMRLPVFSMGFLVDTAQRAVSGTRDYFRIMELQPDVADRDHAPALTVGDGRVVYDNVFFSYNRDEPVLKGISFTIEPGERVALVGESGEGKTTITSLLLRLYDTTSGQIRIDGTPIDDVRQTSLREQIAVVFQDPTLFSGTIRDNIAYAKPHATDTEVLAAARAANAEDFIGRLEKGYDSEIGERGVKLSGGQKQRIAIARAVLKDAPILILDEATSSLDSHTESLVQEAFDRLMHGRTTLIIAHRLSTLEHADKIITLKDGLIDEIGSPAELARTGGIYAQLLHLQSGDSTASRKQLERFEIISEER